MEYLSAYVAGQSRGMPMAPGMSHPKEKEAFELGRKLFFHRAGSWDFSCASCHGEEGKRIRMQELPVLYQPAAARPDRRHLARLPRVEQPVQDHAVAHQRLLPPDAHAGADLRFRGHRSDQHVPHGDGQGRALPRAGDQAMRALAFW